MYTHVYVYMHVRAYAYIHTYTYKRYNFHQSTHPMCDTFTPHVIHSTFFCIYVHPCTDAYIHTYMYIYDTIFTKLST